MRTSISETLKAESPDRYADFLQGFVLHEERYKSDNPVNAMSVDVEDYFQVSAFENVVARDSWSTMPARLPGNITRILALFDDAQVKATFFTLGWVCQKFPSVIREIAAAGHEIASHGQDHARIGHLTRHEFLQDAYNTRLLLEDTAGCKVTGYRAPSFSIGPETLWAHDVLAEAGYLYSSSVFPVSHDHYGLPAAPRFPFSCASDQLLEIPMSTLRAFGRNWPCSGGGYFRLFPLFLSRWGVDRINRRDRMPAIFYFHPWELDPDQPRIPGISAKSRFRHYLNLSRFESRLTVMLKKFSWDRIDRIFLEAS